MDSDEEAAQSTAEWDRNSRSAMASGTPRRVVAEAHVVEPAPPPLLVVADEVGGRLRGFLVAVHASALVPRHEETRGWSQVVFDPRARRDVAASDESQE